MQACAHMCVYKEREKGLENERQMLENDIPKPSNP